ncbi:DUF2063 domain-containing protein [Bacterioplanes sanyensis]|uniref:HvfC family RiPP maturation protein n=1 Tax=Bacterioplanes sanyensis TaxID=1249553 RepID=UPI001678B9D4|nr:putative DNA-binding domain-containing protein [Bacterioplanes sanyensis]GGY40775.1 DUF2063 domain-containing protein [Bacterioplanes sanyensis]
MNASQTLQQQLADSIRGAQPSMPEGVSERALGVYRDLFFNNVLGFIDGTFPVCEQVVSAQQGRDAWLELVRHFLRDFRCSSPLFVDIPLHFLEYLQQQGEAALPAHLQELAHYEWLELAVDIDPAQAPALADPNGDLAACVPVLAPAAQGFLYQYPVHTISTDNPTPAPQATALIVFRDRQDQPRFLHTNPMTLALLAQLQQSPQSGLVCVKAVLTAAGQKHTDAALHGGLQILQQWHREGLIIGVRATERL